MTLPIDTTLLPPDVRAGGAKAQKLYASALDFEKLLTTQLTQSLASALSGSGSDDSADDASGDGSDGVTSGGTDGTLSQLQSQLPAQLADAIQQGGGLGLAPVLYRALAAQDGGLQSAETADRAVQARIAAAGRATGGAS